MDAADAGTMTGPHDARTTGTPDRTAPDPAGSRVAWLLLCRLVDDVAGATRALGLDADTLLVWGALARENLAPLLSPDRAPTAEPDAPAGPRLDRRALRPVRVADLVQRTGIPRETVRRKLLALESAGRAERVVHGWVVGATPDAPALMRLADASLHRLGETWRAIEATRR